MHSPLDDLELDDRQDEHEEEQHDGLRAGEPELEVLERVEIDAVDERACVSTGPPRVSRWICVNACNTATVSTTSRKKSDGETIGTVIRENIRIPRAPSSFAAS